jgi:two-component system LytT family sensor kinase
MTETNIDPFRKRRLSLTKSPDFWKRLAIIWGIWTFIGLVFTLQMYFASYRSERPTPFITALYVQMVWAYIWALATPLILIAAAKLPIERNNWLRSTLLHIPISLAISVVTMAIGHALLWLYLGRSIGRPYSLVVMGRFVLDNFSEGIGIYLLIALISYAFSYYRQYRESQLRTLQLEAQLSKAQLDALKMQLQPHFLFNTLHSISALLSQDTEAARRMITRLGDFLRMTLENSGSEEVTLQQEIEFLSCYLAIERIRFQDRLTTRIEIPSDTLNAKVPNLILQPIVENAIRHGIAPRSTPGLIEIEAKHLDGHIRIQVRDNGPGLTEHRISENPSNRGLGLANTEKRLESLYGQQHLFDLRNSPNGGFVVTMEFPFHTNGALKGQFN